jgi:spore coat polysaccharide biosynthesis protein SpsF
MILAVLQARVTSKRLPGKVLKEILGKPMLALQIERIQSAAQIDHLVVATSNDNSDQPIAQLCSELKVDCCFGSLDDVLERFYQAALKYKPKHVVRLTGDCPLADPSVIDSVIKSHLRGDYDYSSNVMPPTFPDGLDVEILKMETLADIRERASLPSDREHVTTFIRNNPSAYQIANLEGRSDLSQLRWTVDEESDFDFISRVYCELYPRNAHFNMHDVLQLLQETPSLSALNQKFKRNEGYEASKQRETRLAQ